MNYDTTLAQAIQASNAGDTKLALHLLDEAARAAPGNAIPTT